MTDPDPPQDDAEPDVQAGNDEQRRKFRAALERKNAHHSEMHADGDRNLGVRQARNDKQQREFRRKSS